MLSRDPFRLVSGKRPTGFRPRDELQRYGFGMQGSFRILE